MNLDQKTINEIKRLFPNYAFLFEEGAGGFGDDLLALLVQAVKDPNYTTDRFDIDKLQTRYFKETSDAAQLFDRQSQAERTSGVETMLSDLVASYGDAFTSPAQARQIATQAARLGLKGNRLKNFVYGSVVRAGAPQQVAQTVDATKLRNMAKEYGYQASDAEINAVLSGEPYRGEVYSEQTLLAKAKAAAKGTYAHLAGQIDAGLSLDDIFKNYRTYAASILELDPNEIDFVNDPKWARAFGTAETGQMTLTDWVRELKSKDEYGYQFTNQAKQQATNLVMEMEKAFGFRR